MFFKKKDMDVVKCSNCDQKIGNGGNGKEFIVGGYGKISSKFPIKLEMCYRVFCKKCWSHNIVPVYAIEVKNGSEMTTIKEALHICGLPLNYQSLRNLRYSISPAIEVVEMKLIKDITVYFSNKYYMEGDGNAVILNVVIDDSKDMFFSDRIVIPQDNVICSYVIPDFITNNG